MVIKLHNTLTGTKETFKPIDLGKVRMYNCGPTVYNYVHIGNLSSSVFSDILRRVLEYNDFNVTQVMNITDIGHLRSDADEGEDKMTFALKREGKPLTLDALKELADFYTKAFLEDLISLNVEIPTALPKASENVEADIELIKKLEAKEFTYTISDGVYFDTSKDRNYGRLRGINLNATSDRNRIVQNPEKKQPQDFALWKFNDILGWESKWGKGFPGWHIECSAMSMKYLGETFDIHTGGIDHIPIHHNNEIAQSESATGKPLANYWLHHGHITVDGERIAKSLKNDIYLKDIAAKNVSLFAYRYWLLTANYQTQKNFTYEALEGAETTLKRLVGHLESAASDGLINESYRSKFTEYVNDNLDTPKALALIWDLIKDPSVSDKDKKATILDFDRVLGLNLEKLSRPVYFKIPDEIKKLAEKRQRARKEKDWQKADDLRKEILNLGFEIKDEETGYKISKLN